MKSFTEALEEARQKAILHPSPRRKWYWKMRGENRCVTCGIQLKEGEHIRCSLHRADNTKRKRKSKGFKPWKPGGPGRRPINE